MKQKYSRLFGVLALIASASILFGCKQNIGTKDNSSLAAVKITVTVQGDEQVIVQEPKTFQVDKESVWKTVKEKVKVTYKDGYELLRWNVGNKDGKVLTDEYVFTENTTVFAVSKLEGDYTITYHFDDGINDPSNPASYNVETETITLNPADRTGYTFKGWFDNEACTGDAVTEIKKGSTGNKDFWAKWEINTYPVIFSVDGENGALKAKVKESGSEITSGAQVEHGKTVVFTAEPADGYAVEQRMLNGDPVSAVGRNVTYEYAITAKTNVTVQFKKIEKEVGVIVLKDGTYRTKEIRKGICCDVNVCR